MKIDINTLKNFTTQYNKLQDEYGTYIAKLNGFDEGQLSYTDFIDNFIDKQTVADSSIDGNSNVHNKDIVTLEREMCKPHSKLLAFNKIYYEIEKKYGFFDANKWLRYEWEGKLYLHDGNTSSWKSYCFSYDLTDLAEKGLFFFRDLNPMPAKHLTTFIDFIKEFISYASNRTSGAVGLGNLIPYMFYFWKKDVDSDYMGMKTTHNEKNYAIQNIQRFVYAVNQSYVRDGSQSAFTNTSVFDRPYFEALFGGSQFPDGSYMIDYEEEIIEFQKWYMEEISRIRSECMFTFPVLTISLLNKEGDYPLDSLDRYVDPEFAEWAIKHNMKWCDSNLFMDTSVNSLSNCCRLKSNIEDMGFFNTKEDAYENAALHEMYEDYLKENKTVSFEEFSNKVKSNKDLNDILVRKTNEWRNNTDGRIYQNSIGGGGMKVGSVKVSTINLARLALDSKDEDDYIKQLEDRVWINLKALDCVRNIIKRNVEKGLLPNFSYGLIDFEHLYNTLGFIGIFETMKHFGYTYEDEFGNTFYSDKAYEFGQKIFKTMREVSDKFIKEYNCDYMINTEQIPGESAAAKLMRKDKFFYPDGDVFVLPLYGNQFIPLGVKTTFEERVKIASLFDGYCSGGSILHANLDAPFDSYDKALKMTNYIASKGVTYFAFNPRIQVCKHNHAFYGKTCPKCGSPVDGEYTRIVGFFTKINSWSEDRKAEYELREWEDMNGSDILE